MNPRVLVDTGPLVAALLAKDTFHAWAVEAVGGATPPLVTCEAVLTEALHLLRRPALRDVLLEWSTRGALAIGFRAESEVGALRALMSKYANVPMSFADACLVRMAELDAQAEVLTLDADFRVYRAHGRRALKLRLPPGR